MYIIFIHLTHITLQQHSSIAPATCAQHSNMGRVLELILKGVSVQCLFWKLVTGNVSRTGLLVVLTLIQCLRSNSFMCALAARPNKHTVPVVNVVLGTIKSIKWFGILV